jgi:hypothetical protein
MKKILVVVIAVLTVATAAWAASSPAPSNQPGDAPVWVLVVSSWSSTKNMANQLGPYVDKASCDAVKKSSPISPFESECLQVRIPKNVAW